MKFNLFTSIPGRKTLSFAILLTALFLGGINAQNIEYYQLKIYRLENDQQMMRVESFLKQAFLPAMHHAGVMNIGIFKPREQVSENDKQIFVLIPFKTLEQFEKIGGILEKDLQYQSDGKDYINARYDNPPYQRIESILLKAFKDFPETGIPKLTGPRSNRVYELRSYQGPTEKIFQNKVEMFNDGKEINIFNELDFNPVFFGEVISGPIMPNLMYLTCFSSEASQTEHWNSFSNHPDWIKLKDMEKYKNNVSKIDKYLLYPTEYSDF